MAPHIQDQIYRTYAKAMAQDHLQGSQPHWDPNDLPFSLSPTPQMYPNTFQPGTYNAGHSQYQQPKGSVTEAEAFYQHLNATQAQLNPQSTMGQKQSTRMTAEAPQHKPLLNKADMRLGDAMQETSSPMLVDNGYHMSQEQSSCRTAKTPHQRL